MLEFLGIGGAFATKLKNCSAFYKNNEKLLLIDCGENIFEEIIKHKILEEIKEIYLILTHFHTDHIGSLGTLIFYCDKIGINSIKIIYPQKDKIKTLLNMFGMQKCSYEILTPKENKDFFIKEYLQQHSIMESYGYLMNLDGKTIYYSGDTKTIPDEVKNMFFEEKIDYFYQDVRKDINDYHISISELNNIIPIEKRTKIKCMHFNDDNEIEIVEKNGYKSVNKVRRKE